MHPGQEFQRRVRGEQKEFAEYRPIFFSADSLFDSANSAFKPFLDSAQEIERNGIRIVCALGSGWITRGQTERTRRKKGFLRVLFLSLRVISSCCAHGIKQNPGKETVLTQGEQR